MAFDWTEYRRLAGELKTRTDDEAALRSAISRLYYSAFHPAKTHLKKIGIEISEYESSSHQKVWKEFRNRGRAYSGIGVNGERLNENRKYADYKSQGQSIVNLVEMSFHAANNLFTYLETIEKATGGSTSP